jgi:hypothetical protein
MTFTSGSASTSSSTRASSSSLGQSRQGLFLGVADHAHHVHEDHEKVLLLRREWPALGFVDEFADLFFVAGVFAAHVVGESDEEVAIRAVGELGLDIGLAAAEEDGADAFAEFLQVLIAFGAAFVVERVVVAVEPEERAEESGVEEVDDGAEFVDAVFDRSAGEDEGIAAPEALDGLGGAGGPVLDALGLVEHDDVGAEALVEIEAVGHDLLVVGDGEERRRRIVVEARADGAGAIDEAQVERGEPADLLLPLGLQGGRGDDQYAASLAEAVKEGAGGDGLDGFAEAHLVGEQRAFGEGEVQHAFALIGEERQERLVRRVAAGGDGALVIAAAEDAVEGDLAGREPGGGVEGNAKMREGGCGEFAGEIGGIEVGELEAIGREACAEARRKLVEIALDPEAAGHAIGHKVDARRGRAAAGRAELGAVRASAVQEDGFDVLAGAEAVDAKVGACAGELTVDEVTELDAIVEAAGRMDFEIGEDCMRGVEVDDARALLAGAHLALENLVGIGRAPVGDRRKEAGRIVAADAAGHPASEGRGDEGGKGKAAAGINRPRLRRHPPKGADRDGVQIRRKGDAARTGVEQNPAKESFPHGLTEVVQAFEIARRRRGGFLHFDADQAASGVLQYEIHLVLGVGAVVKKRGAGVAPRDLLGQFGANEGLQHGAGHQRVVFQSLDVEAEQVTKQAGVAEHHLGALHQAGAEVGRPSGQATHQKSGLEERPITLERGLRERRIAGEVGEIEEPAGPGRGEAKEPGQFAQTLDVGDVANVALKDRGDVRPKPCLPARASGSRDDFGVAALNDALGQGSPVGVLGVARAEGFREAGINEVLAVALDFTLRKRRERKHLHPAGQRLGYFGQDERVRRTRQEKAARLPPGIDAALDGAKEVGHALHFVENNLGGQAGDEAIGIALRGGKDRRVVEREISRIVAIRFETLDEGGLARLAWPLQENDGRVAQGGLDLRSDMPPLHG